MRSLAVLALALVSSCTRTSPIAITSIASVPRALAIPARTTSALRVMSYNLNFGIAGDPRGVAAIARANPEIVLLQESNDTWEAALVGGLAGFPHHRFAAPRD